MTRAALALSTVLALATAGCFGRSPSTTARRAGGAPPALSAETTATGARRLALVRRGDFLVAPVTIAGRSAGEFLVDTGAGATFVDRGLADALGLPRLVDTQVQGALFAAPAEIRELHGLAAGGIDLVAAPTVAIDLAEVSASIGSAITGVIGFPTLGVAPVTIDFAEATLVVHDARRFTAPVGAPAEILRVNQVPYVEARLEDALDVWLQLDTGSLFAVTLWRDFVQAHADVLAAPRKRWVATSGVGGGTQLVESEIGVLRVLGRDAAHVPVIIQDAPPQPWRHPRIAGRVGLGLLKDRRITLHQRMRRIWIER